jgi:hypothetical protein
LAFIYWIRFLIKKIQQGLEGFKPLQTFDNQLFITIFINIILTHFTMEKQYSNLTEFYPYYLTEHQDAVSRRLHFIGTGLFLSIMAAGFYTGRYNLLWYAPLVGYGFAWVGHFFFEKNKPATFKYPLLSLVSDFIMFWHILTGQLPEQMRQAKQKILNT